MKKTVPLPKNDFDIPILRRKDLVSVIKQQYQQEKGLVVLFAGFEGGSQLFLQESSFYYLTGIQEPGIVLAIDLQTDETTLYIPHCDQERAKWITSKIQLKQENAKKLGVAKVQYLGSQCVGYEFHPFFPQQEYELFLKDLSSVINNGGNIFTLSPSTPSGYVEQRLVLNRLQQFLPGIAQHIIDIAPIVSDMRRKKDMSEIEKLYRAVEVTMLAQEAAAGAIESGALECEVQASLEYMMIGSEARIAFPSIVASGKNATILHYHDNNASLQNGDLVVVDIGARLDHYCADLTRTYPVSGKFTKRQREVYKIVLDTQEYIAELAKPGMWLSHKEHPEKSLNHLAKQYLEKRGYGKYFIHGIGHFLGLDVHDVGDYKKPLQEGDVITIEPGIYIPEESLGIRIEDNYWIVRDGAVCLSEPLPKQPDDIEKMMAGVEMESDEDYFDEDDDFELND